MSMTLLGLDAGNQFGVVIDRQEVTPILEDTSWQGATWTTDTRDQVLLIKQTDFDVQLPGDRSVDMGFFISKSEATTGEVLLADSTSSNSGLLWRYVDLGTEENQFYRAYGEARLLINGTVLFFEPGDKGFEIAAVRKARVNGVPKNYVTIRFSGELRGWYGNKGELPSYIVRDGVFRGVID